MKQTFNSPFWFKSFDHFSMWFSFQALKVAGQPRSSEWYVVRKGDYSLGNRCPRKKWRTFFCTKQVTFSQNYPFLVSMLFVLGGDCAETCMRQNVDWGVMYTPPEVFVFGPPPNIPKKQNITKPEEIFPWVSRDMLTQTIFPLPLLKKAKRIC